MEKARILIVEDQNIIAMDLKSRLTGLGYEVPAVVAYGEEAVARAEELRPDLVLMDIVLKGEMDGVQAAEQIGRRFDLPIIYLTAHSDERTLQRARLTEPYGYILKPFEDRELHMAIEIALYKHRMERKLRESESSFRLTFANNPLPMWVYDLETLRFLEVNASAVTRYGYARQEFLEMRIADIRPPEELPRLLEDLAQRDLPLQSSGPWKHCKKDGQIIEVHIHSHTLIFAGRPAVLVVAEDVTERRQAEAAVHESEARYRNLFEDSPVALWEEDFSAVKQYLDALRAQGVVDLKAYLSEHPEEVARAMSCIRVVDVNRTAVKLYQADTKETLLAQAGRVFVAETQSIIVEELMALAEGRTEFAGEGVNLDLAGNRIDINLRWSVMPGHEQSLSRVLVSIEDITGRKQAEAALQQERNFALQVMNALGQGVTVTNTEWQFEYVNPAYARMLGYEPGQLIGKTPFEVTLTADHVTLQEARDRRQNGETSTYESRFQRTDGSIIQALITSVPRWQEDRIVGSIAVATDLTEIRRAESAVRESEARYRQLFEQASDAIFLENLQGDIIDANQRACDMLGYSRDELLALKVPDVQAPEVRRPLATVIQEQLSHSAGRPFEGLDLHRDGRRIPVEITTARLGESDLVLTVVRDITERKRADEALREAELKYRTLVEQSPAIIYTVELGEVNRTTYISPQVETILGFTPEEWLADQKLWLKQIHPDDREYVLANVRQSDADLRPLDLEYRMLTRAGSVAWIRNKASLAMGETGKPKLSIGVMQDVTERKRAEEERAQLLNVLETTLNEIYIFDAETLRFQYVNQGALRNLGYTREAMSAMTPVDLKPEFDLASFRDLLGPLLRHETKGLVFNTVHRRANNSLYPVEVHLQLSDFNGKRSFHAIVLDITERQQAEEALRNSEVSYRGLFNSVADAIYIQDRNGCFLDVNRGAVEMYGYPREFFIGRTPEILSAPGKNDLQKTIAMIQRAFEGEPQRFEFWGLRSNGEVFPKEVRLYKGAYFGQEILIALAQDITERKQAEAQLRQLSRAVEQSPVSIIITDIEGCIEYVNSRFTEVTGYTRAEVIGQNPRILKSGATSASDYKQLWDTITAGGEWRGEFYNKRKSGELFWELASISAIKNDEGEITNYLAVKEDITERKHTEAALATANAELERALLNARELAVAAQAANRAKSEFLANMSHEIRTPLTAVLGLTELTLAGELTDEQHAWLAQVYTSGQALLELINNILDLSKIEAARLELEKVEFELPALIQQVTTTLAAGAAAKQLEFNYSLSVDLPQVLVGDPVRLRQVLLNLLDNAIKFTERGEVSLRVRQEAQADDDDKVTLHFAVRDTGIGIPEDKQALIFEPFTQADGHITRKFGGTGLGLTISQRLVEKFGGLLWVDSRPGEGSTFHFTAVFALPAQHIEADEEAPAGQNNAPKECPLNILLAEDNPANQIVLSNLLKKRGWQVTLAGTGREALERAAEETFHLILMDLQMPDMDGLAAAAAIRARERDTGGHVPILALTAFAMRGDRERCLQVGMDEYLAKPVNASELYDMVERLISSQPIASAGLGPV